MPWLLKIAHLDNIIIQDEKYRQDLLYYLNNVSARSVDDYERAQNFNLDTNELARLLDQIQYPNKQEVLDSVTSNNWNRLYQAYRDISNWSFNSPNYSNNRQVVQRVQEMMKHLANRVENTVFTQQDVQEYYDRLLGQSRAVLEQIKQIIGKAVQSIPNWQGSPITITCPTWDVNSTNHGFSEPVNGATVSVGQSSNFSIFLSDGKVEVDDILEADDADFFTDTRTTSDYFSLIKALQNKPAQILTLYTARPAKDRAMYQEGNTIPSNIFLTNSYSHATGLAMDWKRDIWRVKIDSRYLVTTLDGPEVRYYQAIGDGQIPVKSMTLVDAQD